MASKRIVSSLLLIGVIASIAVAQTRPADRREPGQGGSSIFNPGPRSGPPERPNLERSMKGMNRALKAIVAQIDDASKDAQTMTLIDALQRATIDAKGVVPDEVNEQAGDARVRETAAYRARMLNLLKAEVTLEESLARGDRAAAKAAIDALQTQRHDGHEEYGVKDHDEPKK